MSLTFNMVGGGGSSAGLPAIYAQYPEGSICTCSNGVKTFTAGDTTGFWLFAGLDIGTWTVTATDGTDTTSQTVEVSTKGQLASVALYYRFYLFKSGVGAVLELAYSYEKYASVTATNDSIVFDYNTRRNSYICHSVYNKNLADVDLTNFSYLKAKAKVSDPYDDAGLRLCVADVAIEAADVWFEDFDTSLVLDESSTEREYSLSVKNISGNKYVGLWGASKATAYDLWLE